MGFLEDLPISAHSKELKETWLEGEDFAVMAPTGSGKSLGLPLLLFQQNLVEGKILIVQPRRVAARCLAQHACKVMDSALGDIVGYHVRFENKTTPETRIIYLTDGMMFRLLQNEKNLAGVELIIFDEFHERSLFMDSSLALVKRLNDLKRIDTRIIVTSATLDLNKVNNYLNANRGISVSAKSYPVSIKYKAPKPKINLSTQVCDCLRAVLSEFEGDVLVFMDGAASIRRTIREISEKLSRYDLEVLPFFGDLSHEAQDRALSPNRKRKVIVSTNLAETSLTIQGVRIVIDTGLAKKYRFDPYRGVNVLLSETISKSAAKQRSGRAGRTSEGMCVRMWSENENSHRKEYEEPEINRLDLAEIYLNLICLGIEPDQLNWFEGPSATSLNLAKSLLIKLGAIDLNSSVSALGFKLAKIPLHPRLGLALLLSEEKGCLSAFALLLSALDFKNPVDLDKRKEFLIEKRSASSDLEALQIAYEKTSATNFNLEFCKSHGVHGGRFREIEKIAILLCSTLGKDFNYSRIDPDTLTFILLKVYPERLAFLENKGTNTYVDYSGNRLQMSKFSVVRGAQWVLAMQVVEKKNRERIILQMEDITEIKICMIRQYLGDELKIDSSLIFDCEAKKAYRRVVEKFGEVIVSQKDEEEIKKESVAKAYACAIASGDLKLKYWNQEVDEFLARIYFVSNHFSEYGIEEFNQDAKSFVLEDICSTFEKWKEIRSARVLDFIHSFYGKTALDIINEMAPVSFQLGPQAKPYILRYEFPKVYLSAPIQKFYDINDHPKIGNGQIRISLEMLAPNGRVAQCTEDLSGFWEGSYQTVKKELAGRYPKHEWR